jgi:putative polyhydroxyalkanoate system protein
MPDIDIKRAHNLGLKAARAAADQMAEHLGRRFGLKGDWSGNVMNFERPGVTGSLAVDEKDLRLVVNLGFLLKAMRGAIEGAVHEELEKLFAKPSARPPASSSPGQAPPPGAGGGAVRSKKAPGRPKKAG